MLKVGFVCENASFGQVAKALGKFFAGSLMVCYAAGLEMDDKKHEAAVSLMYDMYHIQLPVEDFSVRLLPNLDLLVVLGPAIGMEILSFENIEEWEFDPKVPEEKLLESIRYIERKVLNLAERIEAGEYKEE